MGPLDTAVRTQGRSPSFQLFLEFWVDGELRRPGEEFLVQRLQLGRGYRGLHRSLYLGSSHGRRLAGRRGRPVRLLVGDQSLVGCLPLAICFTSFDGAVRHQPLGVERPHRRMLLDPGGHERLGVGRLVTFVVAVTAVAHQVYQHVLVECFPVVHRQPHRSQTRFGIVGVDVDDGNVEALGQVAGVVGRAGVTRVGGETDLVVGDDV